MLIRIKFDGGPLNGDTAIAAKLYPFQVFFDDHNREVYIYERRERIYVYDLAKSKKASAIYDTAKELRQAWQSGNMKLDPTPAPSSEFEEVSE